MPLPQNVPLLLFQALQRPIRSHHPQQKPLPVQQAAHFNPIVRGSKVTEDPVKVIGPKDNARMDPCTPIQTGTEMGLGTSPTPGPVLLLETPTTSARRVSQDRMELALLLSQVHQPPLHMRIWALSTKTPRLSRSGNLGQTSAR